MGQTPEQRDSHELCGARKKNGEIFRAFAGQAKRRMVKLGAPIHGIKPQEALQAEESAHHWPHFAVRQGKPHHV